MTDEEKEQAGQLAIELFEKTKGKKGEAGTQLCPICGNTVRYWTSTYNGHLRVRCDTEGCIQMIQ
jgi:hypothetical protein